MTVATQYDKDVMEKGISSFLQPVQRRAEIAAGVLTGGFDRPYAFGLAMALASNAIRLDVIGSDEVNSPEMQTTPGLNFLNFHGTLQGVNFVGKLWRVLAFYAKLLVYAATTKAKILHVLWNNKFQYFDRTLLLLYFKLLGKKLVFTAHNVNAGKRDGNDSPLNRLTLKIQYRLMDHIFVHTQKMKDELLQDFGVPERAVTVIPFGINNSVPDTDLTPAEAKRKLGIRENDKTILFFGAIRPYKGLEYLVSAFLKIAPKHEGYKLIIAGEQKKGAEQYWSDIEKTIANDPCREQVIQKIEFVPDSETELYFKAADVSVLPYTLVFQSGVLFLSYSFGLPAIASDVGSFEDDIIQGTTGFVCKVCDADDLARVLEKYFESDLFRQLDSRRQEVRDYARARHSWEVVGEMTRKVYDDLLKKPSS